MDARWAGIAVLALAWLPGCMVGPNFRQPDPPDLPRYTETPMPDQTASAPGVGGAAQRLIAGGELPAQWWTLFRSEPLDRLIRQAVADSPNLAAAEATLRQARANLAAQTGALPPPRVDANLRATRETTSAPPFGQERITPS